MKFATRIAALVAGLLVLDACSGNDGQGRTGGGDDGTINPTMTGSGDGDGDGDGENGGDPKWDTLFVPDGYIPDIGCTKVDFMFVIDNSGSMSSHQQNLINNYPAFIQGIQDSLEDVNSYQVGIMTTDKSQYASAGCTNNLSGLISKTYSQNCGPFADGYNFMTEADDLAQKFPCAANVGINGNGYELPMETIIEAVQEPLDQPGQCNEEFLREDSLLVVVILTDEADGNIPVMDLEGNGNNNQGGNPTSAGTPQSWFDEVVAQRGGIESNVVIMSFINYNGGQCPPQSGYYDGENMKQFTEMFTYGFLAGICEPDFGPAFQQAIAVIDEACDNYVSPG